MTNRVCAACGVFIALVACAVPSGAQPTPEQAAQMEDASRLRKLTMGIVLYTHEHDDQMPGDLLAIAPYLSGDLSKASAEDRQKAMREWYRTDAGVRVPADFDGEWLAKNSSYAYLPGPGIKTDDTVGWERLAVAHLKFDRGLAADQTPMNPEGQLFTVAFMDSRVEIMNRADAEAVVAESSAIYEALKTGRPLPDSHQVLMDLRVVMGAITAYAKAHQGELPPNLGATLAFVPKEPQRFERASERAKVFLSPQAKHSTHIPEEPTAEWVNEKTSWVYLGSEGVPLSGMEDPRTTILVHGRFDSAMEYSRRATQQKGIPIGMAAGNTSIEAEDYARWIAGVSKRVVESAKTGAPLPEHLGAYRDVRILVNAMAAYAKEHRGMLPPDLGALWPHVLKDAKAKDRAQVFLSPGRERTVEVPDEVTPEWINANCSYIYLAPGSVDVSLAREAGAQLFIHGPIRETYDIMVPHATISVVPVGMSFNYPWLLQVDSVDRMARESADTLKALHAATK